MNEFWTWWKFFVGALTTICLISLFGVAMFLIIGMMWMSIKEAYVDSGWLGAVFLGMLHWLMFVFVFAWWRK